MFDAGLLRSHSFDVPIISVGNLEMGGTGKSPLVLQICEVLLGKGLRVALLSRGYGRTSRGFYLVDEKGTATDFGDEPMQARLRFPNLMVAVCESRVEGIRKLLAEGNAPQVIVMDDAFQHRWVKPTLSILTSPAIAPYWKNALFPVGSLREWASGAKRADVLILTGQGNGDEAAPFHGPVFRVKALRGEVEPMFGDPAGLNKGDRVVLLSGIARQERFQQMAEQVFTVLAHLSHPDHHFFTEKDIIALRDAFHSFDPPPNAVLTTEKDAARLHNGPFNSKLKELPIFRLPIHLSWEDEDGSTFNQLIEQYAGADSTDR